MKKRIKNRDASEESVKFLLRNKAHKLLKTYMKVKVPNANISQNNFHVPFKSCLFKKKK